MSEELVHYGMPRRSGRYPWGSGDRPFQNSRSFLGAIADLRAKGMSDTEIARGFGMTTTELRAMRTIARNEKRAADISMALRLKDRGWSNVAIGERMGVPESTVRNLLKTSAAEKVDILETTTNMLRDNVDGRGVIDIGRGVENHMGVSRGNLDTAVAMLKAEGYEVHYVKIRQLGTNHETTIKVLAPPGTPYSEIYQNRHDIKLVNHFSEDGGRTFTSVEPPRSVDSSRIQVRYGDEGGAQADGVIQVRPGVDDISLGGSRYAQVRVAVDGTHYLKGMAVYSNDLPDGVDIVFNTNKSNTGNKLDAMKPMTDDPDLPFGSVVRQKVIRDSDGKPVGTSAMNIVYEEGQWNEWSNNLSSQMLSKQTLSLAKQQLDLAYSAKRDELNEIKGLTNPTVRKKLLETFADGADASAVDLKGASMPRQRTQVILPINSLSDKEVYAPNFRDGESVALIRYPHGGKFEIPELTVNNRNREARSTIGQGKDAIGINSSVASRLSGADFDGDTVLVIPNGSGKIKSSQPLRGLKDFDPQRSYPGYDGMKVMKDTQRQMGDVSNLITDMTIKGASQEELAQAVRHSMVVIDAAKHKLNYKQSAIDNKISHLKEKYQGGSRKGASTLISLASSQERVPERTPRSAALGGPVDKETGERRYTETGRTYTDSRGRTVAVTERSTKMAETTDARTLSSGTPMENLYATHANRLKSMANEARKEAVNTKPTPYSPTARATYSKEVASLTASLNTALKNAPLERQAQLVGNAIVTQKRQARPDMDADELKKIKGQALNDARTRVGAKKTSVPISQQEWNAIQSGAVSNSKLSQILDNTDLDRVRELATPRDQPLMSTGKVARAKSMANAGYTMAEIADALGVSVSTLNEAMD